MFEVSQAFHEDAVVISRTVFFRILKVFDVCQLVLHKSAQGLVKVLLKGFPHVLVSNMSLMVFGASVFSFSFYVSFFFVPSSLCHS